MNFGLPVSKHRWWKGGCACGSQDSIELFQKEICIYKLNLLLKEQGYELKRIEKVIQQ